MLQLSSRANAEGILRERRRLSKPRVDKPLTLSELSFECCTAHPMWGCCEGVLHYIDMESELNEWHGDCLETAVWNRMNTNSRNVVTINLADGDEKTPTSPEGYNVEQQPQMATTSSSECSLNKTQKSAVRSLYCRHFELLFMYFRSNIYRSDVINPGLDSLTPCVNYFDSSEYLSPAEVLHTLTQWYFYTIRRHHCCDFPAYHSVLHDPYSTVTCRPDRREASTAKWGELLVKAAKVMRMVQMLEDLGRRKQCLRGCVGEEEVECCNIVFRRDIT